MKKINLLFVVFLALVTTGAYAIQKPEIQRLRQWPDTLGLYEKFEVSFNMNNQNEYKNPFDPDEIDITTVFTSPSGKKWMIHGFYDYSMGTLWKIRFSPDETGVWSYTINVIDKGGKTASVPKSFVAVKSSKKGPLMVAGNKRYLVHHDGSDFYGVGLWYNGNVKPEALDNLKSLGVNFVSTILTPLETPGSGIGRYDQNICERYDELLKMCEDRDMLLSLNLWFHAYLSSQASWGSNPYQQVTDAKDFFKSDTAWKYQEKLYRYIIARWGYSRALGIWFVVDEINDTDGFRNRDNHGGANVWAKKVHDYFKMNDRWNRPTTGTRAGGIREYWDEGYKTFDIAAREIYVSQGWPNTNMTSTIDSAKVHPLTANYRNYAEETQKLWRLYGKPVIIGETGWNLTFYEPSMPGYSAMHHNALWATLATGTAMTPFWWAYSDFLNDYILNSQLTSIRKFTDKIPVSKLTDIAPANIKCIKGDAYAMKSNEFTFGWVVNSAGDVAGDKVTVSSLRKGKYRLKIYHTWRGEFLTDSVVNCTDGTITFGTPYLRMRGTAIEANYIGQDMAFILEYLP